MLKQINKEAMIFVFVTNEVNKAQGNHLYFIITYSYV